MVNITQFMASRGKYSIMSSKALQHQCKLVMLSRLVALSVSLTLKASILQKFQGGALAPNGKIYACPYRSSSVLVRPR